MVIARNRVSYISILSRKLSFGVSAASAIQNTPCPDRALAFGQSIGVCAPAVQAIVRCKTKRAQLSLRPVLRSDQRKGGAYCRPPWVHCAFRPRARPIGVAAPMLDSKISP